jgi:SOS-response transcriptional repressor LexA
MTAPLTRVQRQTLVFIADYIDRHHYAPTMADISREFGMLSTNAVHERITRLERGGYITKQKRSARSIVLTRLGLELTGRLSPDRIRTSIDRTLASPTGQCPVPAVASDQKENEP